MTVNLFNFALDANGNSIPVTSDFFTGSTMLLLYFNYFGESITYDPDLGVIVTPSNGGGGDGTSSVLVIVVSVVVPVVIIPILLLVAILIAIYLYTYFRRRHMRADVHSINTDSFEYAADVAAETI